MGEEVPSVVVKWLTSFIVLLCGLLGVPLTHSSVMLLTMVACVAAVVVVLPGLGLSCCLGLPVGHR